MTIFGLSLNSIGLLLIGVGFVAVALMLINESRRNQLAARRIEALISDRRQLRTPAVMGRLSNTGNLAVSLDQLSTAISQTRLYKHLLDEEDISLLSKAGFGTEEWAQRFVTLRLAAAVLGLLIGVVIFSGQLGNSSYTVKLIATAGVGFLMPKWILKSVAASREFAFERETVALVDIMRLLQGVGLSVDQSLEVIASQLRDLVPVTGKLLDKARPQVQSGVEWNEILRRISVTYANADFKALVNVLQQIDKFGGAVQEPLRQFADRLVEKERANVRERIGKLTIKLTSVMVATMLPGLLILTGGPGAISILRTFERM